MGNPCCVEPTQSQGTHLENGAHTDSESESTVYKSVRRVLHFKGFLQSCDPRRVPYSHKKDGMLVSSFEEKRNATFCLHLNKGIFNYHISKT